MREGVHRRIGPDKPSIPKSIHAAELSSSSTTKPGTEAGHLGDKNKGRDLGGDGEGFFGILGGEQLPYASGRLRAHVMLRHNDDDFMAFTTPGESPLAVPPR